MKLAIFNGSPRNKKSNSKVLIDHFLEGYSDPCSDSVPIHYLAKQKQRDAQLDAFIEAECILIVFPLYTDCMPGIVMEFFEKLADLELRSSKKIGFIVQSGFPEAIHSVYVERYLKKFTKRLKCEYLGTVIKGGVEGIQIMPSLMTKKLFRQFHDLGAYFAENERFNPSIQEALKKPLRFSKVRVFIFTALNKTGLTNFYWDSNLKKHKAYEKRFDKPFRNITNVAS